LEEFMRSRWLFTVMGALAVAFALRAQTPALFAPDVEMPAQLPSGVWFKWEGGALLGVDQSTDGPTPAPLLYRIDREGKREEIWFEIPGSALREIRAVAGGGDGAIAVCGSAYSSDSRLGEYVSWISPDRKRQTAAQVWPYVPGEIAIAPDGSIWTVGYEKDLANTRELAFNVLAHFNNAGRMLSAKKLRAKSIVGPGLDAALASFLSVSPDRIGWLTNGGEYIEFSLNGKEIGRFDGPAGMAFDKPDKGPRPRICGFTLSPGNQALLCVDQNDASQVLALDRESRTWRTALPPQKGDAQLVGFDREGPVMLPRIGDLGLIRRYKGNSVAAAQ
jgi:hypothetical protein